jgi:hypothetical protein
VADFSKTFRASLFNEDLRMSLISAGSISLDSTFNWTTGNKNNFELCKKKKKFLFHL